MSTEPSIPLHSLEKTLPRESYLDEGEFEREYRAIFESGWVCVGRSDALTEAGHYLAIRLQSQSLLIVRGDDGALGAFYNVCRHRGTELVPLADPGPVSGQFTRSIVCPYHAWSYHLDGRLRGTPHLAVDTEGVALHAIDLAEWGGDAMGASFQSPLPAWNYAWFLPLGIASFVVMVVFTKMYQSSFHYALTDKRIHIRKRFLYFDTSVHGISFNKVENLKADPTILGRIFGFGNVHIVTGSGVGLQVESLGMTAGGATEVKEAPTGVSRVISLLFGWITMKRDRTVMATDPADCLYGVKNPMGIYRLINELIDKEVGPTGSVQNSDPE